MKTTTETDYPKTHLLRLAAEATNLDPRSRRIVEALLARTPEVVKADDENDDWRVRGGDAFSRWTSELAEDFGLTEKTVRKHLDAVPGFLVDGRSRTRGWRKVRLSTANEISLHDRGVAARERAECLNASAGTSGEYNENGVRAIGANLVFRAKYQNLPDELAEEFLAFVGAFEKKVAGISTDRICDDCGGELEVDPSEAEVFYCTECGAESIS